MADNNLFVGKWLPVGQEEAQDAQLPVIQFYKDGSCLIPAFLLGKEDLAFYFYQVFENGMMKLESGSLTTSLYHCSMVGETLTLTAMDGASFSFMKIRDEKRSFFKSKASDAAPAKGKEQETEAEREPGEHEWKCPSCGKINQNYVGTCGCGEPKPHDKPYNWREAHPELIKEEPAEEPAPEPESEPEEPKKPVVPEREPEAHEWKCPSCGKINQNYVGTCGCGEPKPFDKPAFNWREVHPELIKEEPVEEPAPEPVEEEKPKKPPIPEREPEAHEWKCPSCGKINQNYVGTCGCGEPKPFDKPAFNWREVHPELVKETSAEEEPAPIEASQEETKPEQPADPGPEPGENEWKCPGCGKINQNYVGTCGCGQGKPKKV